MQKGAFMARYLELISLDLNTLQTATIFKMDSGWKNSLTRCSADGKYIIFSIKEFESLPYCDEEWDILIIDKNERNKS